MYKSDNEGAVWLPADSGLTFIQITSMVSNWTSIFCGSVGGGIFISNDNGSSWNPVNSGLESTLGSGVVDIYSLTVYNNTVYAGTSEGLFSTTNNGANWTKKTTSDKEISIIVNDSIEAFITPDKFYIYGFEPYSVSPHSLALSGSIIYVGTDSGAVFCFKKTDSVGTLPNGNSYHKITWNKEKLKIPSNSAVTSLLIKGNLILAGTNTGELYIYDSTISSWSPLNSNTHFNSPISCLFYCKDRKIVTGTSGDGNKLFAGSNSGVFISNDSGVNWRLFNNGFNKYKYQITYYN